MKTLFNFLRKSYLIFRNKRNSKHDENSLSIGGIVITNTNYTGSILS